MQRAHPLPLLSQLTHWLWELRYHPALQEVQVAVLDCRQRWQLLLELQLLQVTLRVLVVEALTRV